MNCQGIARVSLTKYIKMDIDRQAVHRGQYRVQIRLFAMFRLVGAPAGGRACRGASTRNIADSLPATHAELPLRDVMHRQVIFSEHFASVRGIIKYC